MLGEVTHLQAISDDLKALTSDPHTLPPASEQVRKNIKDATVCAYATALYLTVKIHTLLILCVLFFFYSVDETKLCLVPFLFTMTNQYD